jgi:hypothetical protein
MKYVYHFHATCQMEPGVMRHFDGLLTRHGPILDVDDYDSAKQAIADWADPKLPVERLIIQSLSLLNTTE